MQNQESISARNIFAVSGAQYVLWTNILKDSVHARLCRAIDIFCREEWYIDGIFEDEEAAVEACCQVIEINDSPVRKISEERRESICRCSRSLG